MAHCDTTAAQRSVLGGPGTFPELRLSLMKVTGREVGREEGPFCFSSMGDARLRMTWSRVEHLRKEISLGHHRTLQQLSGRLLEGQSQRWKSLANPSLRLW